MAMDAGGGDRLRVGRSDNLPARERGPRLGQEMGVHKFKFTSQFGGANGFSGFGPDRVERPLTFFDNQPHAAAHIPQLTTLGVSRCGLSGPRRCC
jgi:hypothetical protein